MSSTPKSADRLARRILWGLVAGFLLGLLARTVGSHSPTAARAVQWFAREDTYSRIDYLLVSPGMRSEFLTNSATVLALPNWGLASDHRPITAPFSTRDG